MLERQKLRAAAEMVLHNDQNEASKEFLAHMFCTTCILVEFIYVCVCNNLHMHYCIVNI